MISTLVLLRHAKSAYPPGVDDHDRPLNDRGRRDAPVAGALIAADVGPLDTALVSTAVRAQQTWDLAATSMRVRQERDEPGLYLASADAMLSHVRHLPGASGLIVAHNPGTEELASLLCDDRTTAQYFDMTSKFPTAAFAVLRSEAPFGQWRPGCASLASFEVARG